MNHSQYKAPEVIHHTTVITYESIVYHQSTRSTSPAVQQCLLGLWTLRGVHRDRPLERCLLRCQQALERGALTGTCRSEMLHLQIFSKSPKQIFNAETNVLCTAGQGLTHCAGAWNAESRPAQLAAAEPSWKPPMKQDETG